MVAMGVMAAAALMAGAQPSVSGTAPRAASGFRVAIARPGLTQAVTRALGGAQRRLGDARCAQIFSDFKDGQGRPLKANLEALGMDADRYLEIVHFRDGQAVRPCQRGGIVAATMPGSRVVWVCPAFMQQQLSDAGHAEAIILHEVLHSLGLGENPPSSAQITAVVLRRCIR